MIKEIVRKSINRFRYKYSLMPRMCPGCRAQGVPFYRSIGFTVIKRRINTRYVDEERNYSFCCLGCFIDICEHYQDLWDSYYSGLF